MPFKHTESVRHKFKKGRYKVKNWEEYNESLCRRGDVTFWFSEEAIESWTPEKTGKKGRPRIYSDMAIETGLSLRMVFHLGLRQTEGFMKSVGRLLQVDIPIPDYSTLSDRCDGLKMQSLSQSLQPGSHVIVDSSGLKVYGAGEWHQVKHNLKKRRVWNKLHLAVDEKHQVIAATLTTFRESDESQVPVLLDQLEAPFETFMADGAYDGKPTYEAIEKVNPQARIIIPPPKNAVISENAKGAVLQRNQHIQMIQEHGVREWQRKTGYGLRSHSELAFFRYKKIIGPSMRARALPRQKTEATIGCSVLNKMVGLGMPVSIKVS